MGPSTTGGHRGLCNAAGSAYASSSQPSVASALRERPAFSVAAARGLHSGRGCRVDSAAAQPLERIAVGDQVPIGGVHFRLIGRLDPGKTYQVPAKDVFAVIEVGPHQFKVTTDDLIYVEKIDLNINDKARLMSTALLWFSHSGTPLTSASRSSRAVTANSCRHMGAC